MLFRQRFLDGIRAGEITLAFRRWRRPSVRAGGSLLTAVGKLGIGKVTLVTTDSISERDARRAGYASRDALLRELASRDEGEVYRVELGPLEVDPRIALRKELPAAEETAALLARLAKLDASAAGGPWTRRTLEIIAAHEGVRAGDLAEMLGRERLPFKVDVRKLKALGLTESLEIGYRLSPRGKALLVTAW